MVHVDAFLHAGHLIKLATVIVDIRIRTDASLVALEIDYINFVKTNQSHE